MRAVAVILLIFLSAESLLANERTEKLVSNMDELKKAISTAQPGDEIVMKNGVWKDVEIKFRGNGTKDQPITLRAEEDGKVSIEGRSYLKLGGEYLVVSGLYFTNGSTPSSTVISYMIDEDDIANHCRVTNTAIVNFNQQNRFKRDNWVQFWGRHNQLDHCYIAGKFNHGATLIVNLRGNEHIRNYHRIEYNHFGPRPRKGGPSAETMRMGSSYTSMAPAHVQVLNNYFDRCNGEVEIISSKSNYNEFRNNIFYECEGSLVTRHGNYCIVDGNLFIGNKKPFTGGIRVINTGHWVTNNYFYGIVGEEFRSALAIMNGIPKSPLNRYNQVTDAVVAFNSWIDCKSPLQFSVGANMDKKDVLPLQEIRSARPARTLVANNLVVNHEKDEKPVIAYDKVDGIRFESNVIDNEGNAFADYDGINANDIQLEKMNNWLFVPASGQAGALGQVYPGFEFETINKDVFGNSRGQQNAVGAICKRPAKDQYVIDEEKYGPSWFTPETKSKPEVITVSSKNGELVKKIKQAKDGDILELAGKKYKVAETISISKNITIRAKDGGAQASITFENASSEPCFEMLPYGDLRLENISLVGNGEQIAIAPSKDNSSSSYKLKAKNVTIQGFEYVMKAYKGTFADTLLFEGVNFTDCANGFELAAETDDKGDYNAEVFIIKDCSFSNIEQNTINFYRGGYDESTIGGILHVEGSEFTNCGGSEKSDILLQTRGIINVDISNNQFKKNSPKYIAILWGEKNNQHSGNTIEDSGELIVQMHLKQKQIY